MRLQRLKTRPQFKAVLSGTTLARTPHFVLQCCDLLQTAPQVDHAAAALFPREAVWLGAMVPKRWAKRAVTRNTIKRQIYNVAQDYAACFAERAHVVRLRCAFDREEFQSANSTALKMAVRAELHQLMGLQVKAGPNESPTASGLHRTP